MAKMMFNAPANDMDHTVEPVPMAAPSPAASAREASEPQSALAAGLPSHWSIEPPAVVVRRKARAL